MQIEFQSRELTIKLVYYGPALSGKTTNLQALHQLLDQRSRGRMMNLETQDDRTLFFDLLPLSFETKAGLQVRLRLFTVPGQAMHDATRRLVLQGVDGVAFIADSQLSETRANQQSFANLQHNLKDNGFDCQRVPLVIQFNKRDLPNIRSEEEIRKWAARGREPVFSAIATRGIGVLETFLGLLDTTLKRLETDHRLQDRFGLERATALNAVRARFNPPKQDTGNEW